MNRLSDGAGYDLHDDGQIASRQHGIFENMNAVPDLPQSLCMLMSESEPDMMLRGEGTAMSQRGCVYGTALTLAICAGGLSGPPAFATVKHFDGSSGGKGGNNICGSALPNGCWACYDSMSGNVDHVSDTKAGALLNCPYGAIVAPGHTFNDRYHLFLGDLVGYLVPQLNINTLKLTGQSPADWFYLGAMDGSGTQGVSIALTATPAFWLQWSPPPTRSAPTGPSSLALAYIGVVNGVPHQPCGAITLTAVGTDSLSIDLDNETLGTTTARLEIWYNGAPAGIVPSYSGALLAVSTAGQTAYPGSVERRTSLDAYRTVLRWNHPVIFRPSTAIGLMSLAPPTMVGDELRLTPIGGSTPSQVLSDCVLTGRNLAPMFIADELDPTGPSGGGPTVPALAGWSFALGAVSLAWMAGIGLRRKMA